MLDLRFIVDRIKCKYFIRLRICQVDTRWVWTVNFDLFLLQIHFNDSAKRKVANCMRMKHKWPNRYKLTNCVLAPLPFYSTVDIEQSLLPVQKLGLIRLESVSPCLVLRIWAWMLEAGYCLYENLHSHSRSSSLSDYYCPSHLPQNPLTFSVHFSRVLLALQELSSPLFLELHRFHCPIPLF